MNLDQLTEQFSGDLEGLMTALSDGRLTSQGWLSEFEAMIARYHIAALLQGGQMKRLSETAVKTLTGLIAVQLGFAAGFFKLLRALGPVGIGDRMKQLAWRAKLYAGAIRTAWDNGDQIRRYGRILPLPAQISQGTQCGNNDRCTWRIEELDRERGDFDAYWELDQTPGIVHCQTCLVRAREWNPVRIRGWRLMP